MVDLLLTPGLDLLIENGDLALSDSTQQNQQILLLADKGILREHPTAGVGIESFLKDDNGDEMLREIRIQFTKDGMKVRRLGLEGSKLAVDASYGS